MAALDGYIEPEFLRFYRKGHSQLPGHPELGLTPGVQFSSGRLGHMWGTVNGIAMANPGKIVLMLGSDGSQMEGNDAEAARLAVARGLPVKLVLDDNNVTITGHPEDYLKGYSLERTLAGHGLQVPPPPAAGCFLLTTAWSCCELLHTACIQPAHIPRQLSSADPCAGHCVQRRGRRRAIQGVPDDGRCGRSDRGHRQASDVPGY